MKCCVSSLLCNFTFCVCHLTEALADLLSATSPAVCFNSMQKIASAHSTNLGTRAMRLEKVWQKLPFKLKVHFNTAFVSSKVRSWLCIPLCYFKMRHLVFKIWKNVLHRGAAGETLVSETFCSLIQFSLWLRTCQGNWLILMSIWYSWSKSTVFAWNSQGITKQETTMQN